MKAVRLIINQSSANYKKEETSDNKMTYPLPPLSTVIGAIHVACGYKTYHPMDVSIQGKYESMHKEPYTDYCFLNSVNDDRGILIKMRNPTMLSTAFDKVAKAKKSKGNSFKNGVTIEVYNEQLLKEYQGLKFLKDDIDRFKKDRINRVMELIKKRKKTLDARKKNIDKTSIEFSKIQKREKEIKELEKLIKLRIKNYEEENYTEEISKYRSLTTSLKFYEILDNVNLIIHIKSDKRTMNDIVNNAYSIKSIGRSEDFIELVNAEIVELEEDDDCDIESANSAYINFDDIINGKIYSKDKPGKLINGTKYYISKNYNVEEAKNGKRKFEKKKVLYTSNYVIESTSENIFIDNTDKNKYIVNFI
ncbi:MAG: CRISPR-associated protein Cas5 [Mollicutes bacterium]|nr:CRISPR-associated protein Cas5 [Mollicutes bacterium]